MTPDIEKRLELIIKQVDQMTALAIEGIEMIYNAAWNEAIEKVAEHLDEIGEMGTAQYIREELKK